MPNTENLPTIQKNSLIGKSLVENLVAVDEGKWLDDLKQEIEAVHPEGDVQKKELMLAMVKTHLKDAISAKANTEEYLAHQSAIDMALADHSVKMSDIANGGYGVCRHFHAYGLVALEEMGMEAVLAGNPKYRHTFLMVKQDGQWQKEDPFAESYFQNKTGSSGYFPADCYTGKDVVFFGQTSKVKEFPLLSNPAEKYVMSLSEFKTRVTQSGK